MYSFNPSLHILNGFLQSVIGLHDVADADGLAHVPGACTGRGERAARGAVAAYDTGAWSRYSFAGRESPLSYHELVTGFLEGLCARTDRPAYCDTGARFTRYEHEPPAIHLAVTRRPREDRPAAVSFWVSKVSWVRGHRPRQARDAPARDDAAAARALPLRLDAAAWRRRARDRRRDRPRGAHRHRA